MRHAALRRIKRSQARWPDDRFKTKSRIDMASRGVLQGILTLDDVLEAVAEELDAVVQAMRSGCAREVLRRP